MYRFAIACNASFVRADNGSRRGKTYAEERIGEDKGREDKDGEDRGGECGADEADEDSAKNSGPEMIIWTFVPLKPNELIPAVRLESSTTGHGVGCTGIRIGISDQGMSGLGCFRCKWGGIMPCCSASTTFIILAIPADASR